MKYIDTDKLIARIQWLKKKQDITLRERNILIDIEIAIDSLQQEQPEVSIEKEIDACWQNWLSPSNQKEVEGVLPKTEFAMYAHHFYELGKAAKPKVMQEVSDNVDKLRAISTPAEENWFEIAEEWEKEDKEDAMTEQGFRIIDDGIWISRSELEKMRRKFFGSALEAMDVKKYDPYRNGYFGGMNNLCLELLIRIDGCRRPLTEGTSCALNFQTDDHASDH